MIKNEKGLTLVELLASIALISVVATLGIMFYISSNLFWERSVEKYSNDADAELTMAAISKYVTDTVKVFYLEDEDNNVTEIRIKTGEGSGDYIYKSFFLEHNTDTLTLYDIILSDENEDNFASDNTDDLSYENGFLLGSNVKSVQLNALQGGDSNSVEVSSGTLLKNGDLIEFIFEFDHVTRRTMIKLFDI